MKQYVSRRRRCWTLLTQMDPVIRVSEGHRSDMLLDLSGLTCEERVLAQASIDNVISTELRMLSHQSTSTYSPSRDSETREGKRQRRNQAVETTPTLASFRRRVNTLAVENLEQMPVTQTSLPLKITIMMTTRSNSQMLIKHTTTSVTLEVTSEKKLWTAVTTRKTTRFLHMLLWMTSLFWRQLNWTRLLFSLTHGTLILTQKSAHSWCKPMYFFLTQAE